jgi:hypothetical protein
MSDNEVDAIANEVHGALQRARQNAHETSRELLQNVRNEANAQLLASRNSLLVGAGNESHGAVVDR